ncbi:MarR family transcriptional regulator [Curvibacter sp. RS43]|uniref:MarR family winged helix-turn-helix transcriptional regulator n=1 Tax=Curvibacter microcysteis TaxID=3026419 RepID=UPI002361C152|nr:MarR family transcriptional regulator [Curvibacter sp. RS43]MDD0810566.1 MarR family transcriptional regulator [Curvibacter sp. RS43]
MTSPPVSDSLRPGDLDPAPVAGLLGYLLAQATIPTNQVFKAHIEQVYALNKLEFTILMLLSGNEQVTPKRLALALNIPSSNLTLLLDRLELRGVLQRERSDTDRRVQYVTLSPAGQALAREVRATTATMEQDLLSGLSAAERSALFVLLGRVAQRRQL